MGEYINIRAQKQLAKKITFYKILSSKKIKKCKTKISSLCSICFEKPVFNFRVGTPMVKSQH